MKKIEMDIYDYVELSEKAKESARNFYMSYCREESIFSENIETTLGEKFPNIDLDFQYNLSYSQSDCFYLEGKAFLYDVVKIPEIKEKLTPKELKRVEFLYNECSSCIEIEKNLCTYSNDWCCYTDNLADYADIPSWASGKKVLMDTSNKIINLFGEYIEKISDELKKYGYRFFYEVEEEEIEEFFYDNDYEFYANGEIYYN